MKGFLYGTISEIYSIYNKFDKIYSSYISSEINIAFISSHGILKDVMKVPDDGAWELHGGIWDVLTLSNAP